MIKTGITCLLISIMNFFVVNATEPLSCFKCEVEIILNEGESSQENFYEASERISVGGNYSVNSGSDITMNAGETILLTPGTTILKGSKYLAQIAPCSLSICEEGFDYRKYFTPNGDGFNDTWTIDHEGGLNNARVFIFDRYGKLLNEFYTQGTAGWDGRFNNNDMPANDYWFKILYECEGKKLTFAGHFTLKR